MMQYVPIYHEIERLLALALFIKILNWLICFICKYLFFIIFGYMLFLVYGDVQND
jgi:hypothetical protein